MKRKLALVLTLVLTLNLFLMTYCNEPKDVDLDTFTSFVGMPEKDVKNQLKKFNLKLLEYPGLEIPERFLSEKQSLFKSDDFEVILYFGMYDDKECSGFTYVKFFKDEPNNKIVEETLAIIDDSTEKFGKSTNNWYYTSSSTPQESQKPISLFEDFLTYFEGEEKLHRMEEWNFDDPEYGRMTIELQKFSPKTCPEYYGVTKIVREEDDEIDLDNLPDKQLKITYGIDVPYDESLVHETRTRE